MRQIRVSKRHRAGNWRLDPLSQEPLPLDPRDPDIVRAKELARRGTRAQSAQGGSRGLGRK
jgi:hypothetical protein